MVVRGLKQFGMIDRLLAGGRGRGEQTVLDIACPSLQGHAVDWVASNSDFDSLVILGVPVQYQGVDCLFSLKALEQGPSSPLPVSGATHSAGPCFTYRITTLVSPASSLYVSSHPLPLCVCVQFPLFLEAAGFRAHADPI